MPARPSGRSSFMFQLKQRQVRIFNVKVRRMKGWEVSFFGMQQRKEVCQLLYVFRLSFLFPYEDILVISSKLANNVLHDLFITQDVTKGPGVA
jgi:hypothetical protein